VPSTVTLRTQFTLFLEINFSLRFLINISEFILYQYVIIDISLLFNNKHITCNVVHFYSSTDPYYICPLLFVLIERDIIEHAFLLTRLFSRIEIN
jgi:hypothetical protein